MTDIFTPDGSTQDTGSFNITKNYFTKSNPNIRFYYRTGIYNSAYDEIKFFTNDIDALTIDANQKVICNGSLITNLDWNKIDGKPANFPTNWDSVASKPSIFPTNWDNVSSKPSIFPTNWDNVSSKPSIFPTNWDNVATKPTFATVATSGLYNDLLSIPSIFPTNWDSVASKPSIFPTNWDNVSSKPSIFPTNWDNVSSKPSIFPTNWDNVATKPTFATVATSGLYNDLLSIPSIFPTNWDNVSSKPSIFPTNWDNVASKPSIFPTNWDSVASKPSIFPTNWENVSSKPDIFTKIETSNIFITSNVLSNTSNNLFKSIGNSSLTNYFSKSETSNIFTTSNHIQNSLNFINYNNINNKPWINSGNNIYNSNLSGNVGIGTANPISALTINANYTNYSFLNIIPTVWLKFDNPSIPHFNDGSSANNWSSSSATISSVDFVKGNGSISISNSTRVSSTAGSFNISNKSFTIAYWIKSPLTANNHIFGRYGGTNNGSFPHISQVLLLSTFSSTGFSFAFNYDDLNANLSSTEFNSYKNVWTHLVYVFNLSNRRREIYINGVLKAFDTSINNYIANDDGQYIFNATGVNNNTFIDDFRIYSGTALTNEQVLDLYENTNSCFTINASSNTSNYQLKLYPYLVNNSNGFSYKLVDNTINLNKDILSFCASGNGKIGIGTKNPISELDIIGTTYITSNVHIGNIPLSFINSFSNSTLISIAGTNENYLQFTGNGNLILNEPCSCDLLVVGAGGNGATGDSSGGGGAGEVIYYPNFPLRNGTLNITVGISSTTFANRTSKITLNGGSDIIYALGGGDGGLNKIFTSNSSITLSKSGFALFNYTNNTSLNAGTYSITFSNGSIILTGITADTSYPILNIIPTVWLKFDNPSIPHFNDGSSANNWSSSSATISSVDFVKGNGSISISNSTRVSSTAGSFNISNKSFTIAYWIKSPLTANNHIFGRYGGTYNGSSPYISQLLLLSTYSSTGFSFSFNYDDLYITLSSTEFNSYKNVWTHLVYVFNVSNKRREIYINGVLKGFDTSINNYIANDDGQYIFNATGVNNNTFIDDFRIYSGTALTNEQVLELYNGRVNIYCTPTTGGSGGGGGANNQIGSATGTKFDEYKSYSSAGFTGTASTGGNGGSALTTTRYTTAITGTSLSVGLGGNGVGSSGGPTNGVNYGDGGSGNGGLGANGTVIIRFKETQYLQTKGIRDNANTGLILNANDNTNKSQLRLYPYSEIYPPTQSVIRGFSLRTLDGNNNYDLLNLLATFGGRIGIKTKIPFATLDVNGDLKCKQLFIEANEPFGVSCQVMNLNSIGQSGFFIGGGTGGDFGGINLFYDPPSRVAELNNGNSTGDLLLKTYNANSYIRLINSNGNVGIGTYPNNIFRLHVNGAINSSSLTTDTINSTSVSTSSISLNNGNISLAGTIASVQLNTGPISCSSINLTGGNINNGGTFNGTATQARYLVADTNIWHISKDNRERIYFTDDTTTPSNSHTVFKTGSTTHYFKDKDNTDYCLLDRFGISTFFEVISGSGYDNVGVVDATVTGVYVYRRMFVRLSTFTEVHRTFCEDELYDNYDNFINEYIGRIVISKGKIKTALKEAGKDWQILEGKEGITIDDSHCIVELSRTKKNKAVVGVITKRESQDYPGRLVINSLGETGIWVVNTNKNIENGDLITTSDELGYGERQDDDIIHNYTIGKCMIDCNFELNNPNYICEIIDIERDLRRCFLPIFIYSG